MTDCEDVLDACEEFTVLFNAAETDLDRQSLEREFYVKHGVFPVRVVLDLDRSVGVTATGI